MNIFVTHSCPIKSATYMYRDYPKRGIKMILECAQLMSAAMINNGQDAPYKLTHKHHPCTKWISESKANFEWVLKHYQQLARLYTTDYSKTHKSFNHNNIFKQFITGHSDELTPFVNCARNKELNLDFTNIEDTHLAYRKYLQARKELL